MRDAAYVVGGKVGHEIQANGDVINYYETKDFKLNKWIIKSQYLYRRSNGMLSVYKSDFDYRY